MYVPTLSSSTMLKTKSALEVWDTAVLLSVHRRQVSNVIVRERSVENESLPFLVFSILTSVVKTWFKTFNILLIVGAKSLVACQP